MTSKGTSPIGAKEALDQEAKYQLQKVLSETEYKKFKSIQHKIK